MAITVTMIEEKEFSKKFQGYDDHEVDEFLDEICDEMVNLQREIAALQQRNQQLMKQLESAPARAAFTPAAVPVPSSPTVPVPTARPAAAPAPAVQPERNEAAEQKLRAAMAVLEKAQKVYEETVAEAKQKAEKMLEEARVNSDSSLERLESEKKEALDELNMIRAQVQDYKARFSRMLEDQQHLLSTDHVLFGSGNKNDN